MFLMTNLWIWIPRSYLFGALVKFITCNYSGFEAYEFNVIYKIFLKVCQVELHTLLSSPSQVWSFMEIFSWEVFRFCLFMKNFHKKKKTNLKPALWIYKTYIISVYADRNGINMYTLSHINVLFNCFLCWWNRNVTIW